MSSTGGTTSGAGGIAQVPLGELATIKLMQGPAMIRDENGRLSGYVYVDVDTTQRDIGSYVEEAKRAVNSELQIPAGYTLQWSGQYEAMERVKQKMLVVVPINGDARSISCVTRPSGTRLSSKESATGSPTGTEKWWAP